MKYFLFTLIFLLPLITFSQYMDTIQKTIIVGEYLTETEQMKYSGMELQAYSKEFYSGIKMIGLGQVLIWSGVYVIANSTKQIPIAPILNPEGCVNCPQESMSYITGVDQEKKALGIGLTAVGGILTIIGTHHVIEAPIHIKNAGLILSGNGVGIVIKM